jgi:flagellin-like protein
MKTINQIIKKSANQNLDLNDEKTEIIETGLKKQIRKRRQRGVSSVEYVVLLVAVVVVAVVMYQKFGKAFKQKVQAGTQAIQSL